jgi:uncharacterized membrane protein
MTSVELHSHCQDLAEKIVTGIVSDPTKAGDYKARLVESLEDVYKIGEGDSAVDPKDLKQAKSILLSKTFWGIVIAAAAQVAPKFGLHIGSDQMTQYASEIVSLIGSAFAMYGRYKAFQTIA